MKILLIGTGAIASVISRYLDRDKNVSQITCASCDTKKAKEFIDIKNKKISLRFLDASDLHQIVRMAKGTNLIINASLSRFNENIMEAALRVGANYQDLASELADLKTVEQLKFHQRFQDAKLIALINTGVAPGVTNLLAKEAADKLDKVDEIRFRCLEEQKTSEFIFAWSPEISLDDFILPPLIYRNGKFTLTKPFTNPEEYEFPQPFGKKRAFSTYGDEVATIPLFIKVKNVDFKSAGTDMDLPNALFQLGLFEKKSVSVNGKKIIPLELFKKLAPKNVPSPKEMIQLVKKGIVEDAIFIAGVEVIGKQSRKNLRIKISAVFPNLKKIFQQFPGATYISYPAGTAAYTFFKVMPKIDSAGVFPPEALSSTIRKEILSELSNRDVIINEQHI